MTPKKFNRLVNNPRHIPGIHNYCDRWCQRCPLTLRCSVFAIEQAVDRHAAPHNQSDRDLWPRLQSLQPLADELLQTHADHPGIPLAKNPRFNKIKERPLDSSTLGSAAKRYMEFAYDFLRAQGDHAEKITALPPIPNCPITSFEAFDVINWHHMFISVKLSRALHHDDLDDEEANDPELADLPSDHDGSAKIVLISLDRSILAWSALTQIPTLAPTALPALLTLARRRRAVEKHFPRARPFSRPGFDTLRFK